MAAMVLQMICVKRETAQTRLLLLAYVYYAIILVSARVSYYIRHNSNRSETGLYKKWPLTSKQTSFLRRFRKPRALIFRTDLKCCLISTSRLAGLLTFSCYFIFDRIVCVLVTFYQWGLFAIIVIKKFHVLTACSLLDVKSFRSKR